MVDGEKEYIISAFFQGMNMQGIGIRLHSDEYINYVQAQGGINTQIMFTDNPDSKEINRSMEEIQRIFPDCENVETCAETVKDMLGVADTLAAVKSLIVILAIVLAALITVLMERSFIAKEKGEIFAMPLAHLCIDPVFKMMGMELAVDYVINPVEMYLISHL
jgi:putative ABC transport system permease protein